ncbi:DNA (cytosine-5-)-methyltransferase [Spongiibacter sp. KMU-166]|uniref:Cytosine-specific methyltransferase n=1 Tax=Spongiibacter thalassae TaxID=2721624 RepID=A0ABX1GJ83_9GAMM|nr:DNA (cytosine-5-)-methyltransferase [Spongiibacter thalassae]NKI18533.1 DNA (cytosine-5-)-methyltransferase [Spongiibacter thalassae]
MSSDSVHLYLNDALKVYSRKDLACALEIDTSTLGRWLVKENEPRPYVVDRLKQILLPFHARREPGEFKFIDLFAGIGGLRIAFESIGGECVFTSEWDSYAQRTYLANFGDTHALHGDITQVDVSDIPDHDVLLAGFPCQPFSIAGVSKKNSLNRAHGFACDAQGTLFFDVARIIKEKRPRAFLLENVKNLQSHDKGRTFSVIKHTLQEELGYQIHTRIIDGQHFVPQHRERIAIVGFREPTPFSWDALELPEKGSFRMGEVLHKEDGSEPYLEWDGSRFFDHEKGCVNEKYILSTKLWSYLKAYKEKHTAKGNGFGFGLIGPDDVSRTLSARYYKDGSEILIKRGPKNPRRLTPRECARLMGLPDTYRIPVSDTRAYKQFGNSVVMPAFKEVARVMKPYISQN